MALMYRRRYGRRGVNSCKRMTGNASHKVHKKSYASVSPSDSTMEQLEDDRLWEDEEGQGLLVVVMKIKKQPISL